MDIRFIIMWAAFLAVFGAGLFFSKRMNRQIEEDGIETEGVITRVVDNGQPDEIDLHVYVRYRTLEGEELQGILTNPSPGLEPGQPVHVKYHPTMKNNVRLVRK